MAPRRSSSKKRDTRMHAALDAMSPYGFANNLVRSTVNSLLKVYGGADGWIFIEEGSYSLLIETLLEKTQANASVQDDNLGDGDNGASASGSSNKTLLPCSNTGTSYDASPSNPAADTVSASSQTGNQLSIKAVDSAVSETSEIRNQLSTVAVDSEPATKETGSQLPIVAVNSAPATRKLGNRLTVKTEPTAPAAANEPINQLAIMAVDSASASATKKTANLLAIKAADSVSAHDETGNRLLVKIEPTTPATANEPHNQLAIKADGAISAYKESECKPAYSTPETKTPQPVAMLGRRKRKPCFGWISDDDDEEEEEQGKLIELPPAPLSQVLSMFGRH